MVLVQYVPHAFGYKAMNLPFCIWLNTLRRCKLTVMFHEVAFPLNWAKTPRHNLLGAVTRLMARIVSRSATRIMVASAQWEAILRRFGATVPISWAPVPSNVPVVDDPVARWAWRRQCTGEGGLMLGHFANHSNYSVQRLMQIMPAILATDRRLSLLLVGANSHEFHRHFISSYPQLKERVLSTGLLESEALSSALAACDLMVQPYPDGVSTRRCSVSALLAHGSAVVTTSGAATEPLWRESGAVAMAEADDAGALRDVVEKTIYSPEVRFAYQRAAQELYRTRFALHHTVASLLAV
jgi:hypothetical protein